jgi:hypothetical protein
MGDFEGWSRQPLDFTVQSPESNVQSRRFAKEFEGRLKKWAVNRPSTVVNLPSTAEYD